jgi:NAD(P)H dehydrogenase (quinone)
MDASPRGPGPILVTGATGRHGGTGRHAVHELLNRGLPVRAMARSLDERAESLSVAGAEVVTGDFSDFESLLAALEGIESAYFCYPIAAGIAEAAGLFAAAARARGVARIVDLSLDAADPRHPSPQGRAQWVTEQIFEWAGMDGVHLRIEAFFMENLLYVHGAQIREHGVIRNAFGDYPASWIAGHDVGAMVAALLADPDLVVGRTLVVGGTERLDHAAIAKMIAKVAGRSVRFEEVSPEQWREELVAATAARGEANPRGAAHLAVQASSLRRRPLLPLTDHVKQLTGRPPTTFADFLHAHRADLLTP